jgi:hypothetical protein
MESIEQTFNGSVGLGNRVTATISRNGDLVHRMWLQGTATTANVVNAGHALVNEVELEIGGQKIDKQYGDWMEAWSQLTLSSGHLSGYQSMTLDSDNSGAGTAFYFLYNFGFAETQV